MPDLGVGAIIGSSVLGASSANKAAKSQEAAARDSTALQKYVYDETTQNLAPYLGAGSNGLQAYLYELGLGPQPMVGATGQSYTIDEIPGQPQPFKSNNMLDLNSPSTFNVNGQNFDTREAAQAWIDQQPQQTGGTPYQGITMSPQAQFLLSQGRDTIEAGAASRGGLYSGATLKGLEGYRQNVAGQDRDNQLNRLLGLTQMGQSAAAGQGAAGINYATNAGNSMMQGANASAAGTMGVANSFSDAAGNYIGYQQFNKLLQSPKWGPQ